MKTGEAEEATITTREAKHKVNVNVVRIGGCGENTLDSSSKIKQKIIDKLANNNPVMQHAKFNKV